MFHYPTKSINMPLQRMPLQYLKRGCDNFNWFHSPLPLWRISLNITSEIGARYFWLFNLERYSWILKSDCPLGCASDELLQAELQHDSNSNEPCIHCWGQHTQNTHRLLEQHTAFNTTTSTYEYSYWPCVHFIVILLQMYLWKTSVFKSILTDVILPINGKKKQTINTTLI